MSEKPNETANRFSWTAILGQAGVISALIVGWLFLTGWTWAYYYFDLFGVGVSSLALDPRSLPVQGFLAVKSVWQTAALGAFGVFVLGVVATRLTLRPDLMVGLIALMAVAVFVGGFAIGYNKALSDYDIFSANNWSNVYRAQVFMKPGTATEGSLQSELQADLADGCHRLIFQDKTNVVLFRPVRDKSGLSVPAIMLNRSDIAMIRVWPGTQPLCPAAAR